jgi:hypothetical protein
MLHISNKSSYYTVDTCEKVASQAVIQPPLPPVPNVYNPIIMSFDQWYDAYKKKITEMTSYIIEKLFALSSDKYIANFNTSKIKKELIQLFYKTSYNSHRNFI